MREKIHLGDIEALAANVSTYLVALAASCLEVARNPSPRMVQTMCGVLRLAPKTIVDIVRRSA